MKVLKTTACGIIALLFAYTSNAQTSMTTKTTKHVTVKSEKENMVTVGGAQMDPAKNIVENASNSSEHTTLVAAVNEAGLTTTLEGAGPFTVFAPTNEAFEMIGKIEIDSLMMPANKDKLVQVLTYHVVAGKYNAKDLLSLITKNNGHAQLKTVEGGTLTLEKKGDRIMLTDELGTMAFITIKDVYQSNGIVHVVDRVLMPNATATTGKL